MGKSIRPNEVISAMAASLGEPKTLADFKLTLKSARAFDKFAAAPDAVAFLDTLLSAGEEGHALIERALTRQDAISKFTDRFSKPNAEGLITIINMLPTERQIRIYATDDVIRQLSFGHQTSEALLKKISTFLQPQQITILKADGAASSLAFGDKTGFLNLIRPYPEHEKVDILTRDKDRSAASNLVWDTGLLKMLSTFSKAGQTAVLSADSVVWNAACGKGGQASVVIDLLQDLSSKQQAQILSGHETLNAACALARYGQATPLMDMILKLPHELGVKVMQSSDFVYQLAKAGEGKRAIQFIETMTRKQQHDIFAKSYGYAISGLANAGYGQNVIDIVQKLPIPLKNVFDSYAIIALNNNGFAREVMGIIREFPKKVQGYLVHEERTIASFAEHGEGAGVISIIRNQKPKEQLSHFNNTHKLSALYQGGLREEVTALRKKALARLSP